MESEDSLPSSSHEPFSTRCPLTHCSQHVHLGLQLKRWNTLREQLNCNHETLAEMLINNWYSNQSEVTNKRTENKTEEDKDGCVSDEGFQTVSCQQQPGEDDGLKRTSRRKARQVRPTRIPNAEEFGTVNLAPKRSIFTTKRKKRKSKSAFTWERCSENDISVTEEQPLIKEVSVKHSLESQLCLQPRVCINRVDSQMLNRNLSEKYTASDSDCEKSVDPCSAVTNDDGESSVLNSHAVVKSEHPCQNDDECGNDSSANVKDETVCVKVEKCFHDDDDADATEDYDLTSHSDVGDDHVSKDSDSDWSPQKGCGDRKRKLRRSRRIKTVTRPPREKHLKTVDGRKLRWQKAKKPAEVTDDAKENNSEKNLSNSEREVNSCDFRRPKLIKVSCSTFQCEICEVRFNSKAEGKLHLVEHEPHKCSFCASRFKNKTLLDSHQSEKHPATHRCNMCFFTCHTKSELRQHVVKEHQVKPLPKTTLCHICGQQFKVTINVQKHLAEVHGIVEDTLKKYVCDQCGNEYILKQSFRKHQLTHRGKIIPCNVCNKLFATHDHLRRHYNTVHLKLKKHFCPHEGCDMKFAFRRSLTNHINMVHLKLRLFPCTWPDCDRRFYAKKHLTVHLRIHNDEKPHKCDICNYACRQRAALNWHMKKHGIYHEPLDDVTKPTYSQFPSNFKRGRKQTRFRKSKSFSMVGDQSSKQLVKDSSVSGESDKRKSPVDQQENQVEKTSPNVQSNVTGSTFASDTSAQYPTMVKPISKFQLQFGDDFKSSSRDQGKNYSDDSSEYGSHNSRRLAPVNGDLTSSTTNNEHRLDSVPDRSVTSFAPLQQFSESDLQKYNSSGFRASASFQLASRPQQTNAEANYDNVRSEFLPNSHRDHKLNSQTYSSFEKRPPPDTPDHGHAHKYPGPNVAGFGKYEKEMRRQEEEKVNSGVRFSVTDNTQVVGVRSSGGGGGEGGGGGGGGGDLFNSSFDLAQMNRVKSWISQVQLAGFQYSGNQNCFPGDTEHRLVMRKYLEETDSDLRHSMDS